MEQEVLTPLERTTTGSLVKLSVAAGRPAPPTTDGKTSANRMKPDQSLTARYPEVAAMWHPNRNGPRTPDNTTAGNSYRAWWRCPAGHEWTEAVHARTLLKPWKRGDRAACRVCVGFHAVVTFACGHTEEVKAQYGNPERDCRACRKARYEEHLAAAPARSAAAKRLYADCAAQAQTLLNGLPAPHVAAPLLYEWHRWVLYQLRLAIVAEQQFGKTDATEHALTDVRRSAETLVPTVDELRAAVTDRRPVQIMAKAHWPTGWLHHLGALHTPVPAEDGDLIDQLRTVLTAEVDAVVDQYGRERQLRTDRVTRFLTEAIKSWAYGQETQSRSRRWNVNGELSLPVTPGGSTRYGRLDLTVMRPDQPDLVIEIDSAHNEQSIEKLTFARAAGAAAVWVRWRGGRVDAPAGIPVVDLTEATRGLTA
jgi:hypothetical protein